MKDTESSGVASVGNIRARFEKANNENSTNNTEKQPSSGFGNLKAQFEKSEEKATPKVPFPPKSKVANAPKDQQFLPKPSLAAKPTNHTSPRLAAKNHVNKNTSGPLKKTFTNASNEKLPQTAGKASLSSTVTNKTKPSLPFKPPNKPVPIPKDNSFEESERSKLDIKSLASKLESQLKSPGAQTPNEPFQKNHEKQTEKSNQQKAPKKTDKPEPVQKDTPPPKERKLLPLPQPPSKEEDWNSWVDGELPPPFEDEGFEFPAPPPPIDPNSQGRPLPQKPPEINNAKALPPLPPLPPLPSLPSRDKEELTFLNEVLPKNFTSSSGNLVLMQFKIPAGRPPKVPKRQAEMERRRTEVLGPNSIDMDEMDEVYDDIDTDNSIHGLSSVIVPMTEEEEEEFERLQGTAGKVGRPPSDIYDDTMDPADFELEEIYEDV